MLTDTKQKVFKMGQNGRSLGHVTYFSIWGPLLSLVRMNPQTFKFAAALRARNTKQRIKKLGQKGPWLRSRDLF